MPWRVEYVDESKVFGLRDKLNELQENGWTIVTVEFDPKRRVWTVVAK